MIYYNSKLKSVPVEEESMSIISQIIFMVMGAFLSVILTRLLIQNGKAIAANGKAIAENGKAIAANGKAIAENGKAIVENGKAIRELAKKLDERTALIAELIVAESDRRKEIIKSLRANNGIKQ